MSIESEIRKKRLRLGWTQVRLGKVVVLDKQQLVELKVMLRKHHGGW